MRIEVTALDLDRGERNQCTRCPVALALMRATGADVALVNDREVTLYRAGRDVPDVYPCPKVAADFVRSFDLGLRVQPFGFDLAD